MHLPLRTTFAATFSSFSRTVTIKGVIEYKEEAYRAVGIITAVYRMIREKALEIRK